MIFDSLNVLFGGNNIPLNHVIRPGQENCLIQAKHNDIILFSPGTSSFDQFKSYIERGNSFNSYVRQFT